MTRPPAARYRHAEAFMVMRYVSDDGTAEEFVWNSRDGVTPFTITLHTGQPGIHTDRAADVRQDPGWTPPPGMRVFVDLTLERAREHAAANYDSWRSDPRWAAITARTFGENRDAAITQLAHSYLIPGAPDLIDGADYAARRAHGTPAGWSQ